MIQLRNEVEERGDPPLDIPMKSSMLMIIYHISFPYPDVIKPNHNVDELIGEAFTRVTRPQKENVMESPPPNPDRSQTKQTSAI
jgi:hypothetical protein